MTEKTNYELAQGQLGKRSMESTEVDIAYAIAAQAFAALAVADEMKRIGDVLAEAFTPTNEEGKRTLEINANVRAD